MVEYDTDWPAVHEAVSDRIRADLGDAVLALDHYNQRKEAVIRQIYARMFTAHGLL